MKKFGVILFLGLLVFSVFAQEKSTQKLTRAEKKELRRQRSEAEKKIISSIIDARQFVLEADNISNRRGQSIPVNSNINFVMVDEDKAVFQLGSAYTIGVNGVGGFTITGRISNFEVKKHEKSGAYYIHINITASSGFYEIKMDVSSRGNASAEVTAMSRHRINYSGRLVPLKKSRVFKGSSH